MVFSSPIFLFFFLPVTLTLVWITHRYKWRNLVLLLLSAFFYIFGEGDLVLLMFLVITLNFITGKWIGRCKSSMAVAIGITLNILVLAIFKYTAFIIESLNLLLVAAGIGAIPVVHIKLPVGISFYIFQSISYLIDVYRKQNEPQKSFVDLALFICLFPQLIAGPIVRYKDIAQQIVQRTLSSRKFAEGIQRFIVGLGKKVIIANSLGACADQVFELNPQDLSSGATWFAIACYSLQLYFDFSGYSDMAIGLGKMLGFDFLENFRFPYKAKSVREFWQRWHISLSNWFRDYLYIPLGGNRVSPVRVYVNLFTVFFLTGLWHGASWNFVIWGLIHGLFMIVERIGLDKILKKLPAFASHFYMLFVVVVAWVFFRAENLNLASGFLKSMFAFKFDEGLESAVFINKEVVFAFLTGTIMSVNGFNFILRKLFKFSFSKGISRNTALATYKFFNLILLTIVLVYSIMSIASGGYNPFIYFRF